LDEKARALLAGASERAMLDVGQTMLLRRHQRRVMAAFAEARLAAVVVRGPVFAERLHPIQTDRYFSDIDIVVATDDMARANTILGKLGFDLEQDAAVDTSVRKQKYQWLLAGNRPVLIELHGNLVHYNRALRRRISLGHENSWSWRIRRRGCSQWQSSTLVAATSFNRLLYLVDILQVVRALPTSQVPVFEAAVRKLGITLEMATALGLTGATFGDERTLAVASRFSRCIVGRLGLRLVTPAAVFDALPESTVGSRLRRHAFRWLQVSPLARG
jgi:hypothetical protein